MLSTPHGPDPDLRAADLPSSARPDYESKATGRRPFAPDERLQAILADAAAVANATARSLYFAPRDPDAFIYDDQSAWKTGFVGGDYRWLIGDGGGGHNLDARTYFHYIATVITPGMALKMVGVGCSTRSPIVTAMATASTAPSSTGWRLPADPPAKDFWSAVVYDSPVGYSSAASGQLRRRMATRGCWREIGGDPGDRNSCVVQLVAGSGPRVRVDT